jgi:hypothetical protein
MRTVDAEPGWVAVSGSAASNEQRSRMKELMRMNRYLVMAGLACLCLTSNEALGQDNGAGRPPGQGRGNFDPAQMMQRRMDGIKEAMEITDDTEWKAIQPLVEKVMQARLSSMSSGMGRGMFGPPRGRGGDNAGGGDQAQRRRSFGQPNPDMEALQKAVDGKASQAELKTAIARYQEARKAKQAELEKAQADLRKVLTVRQEAVAVLEGLL